MNEPDLLVVGAGPTGLSLALQAHDHGARVRVVDGRSDPLRPSRAMLVHPRTMEVLRSLGVMEGLRQLGERRPAVHLHVGARTVTAAVDDFLLPDTSFPYLLVVRQSAVETVLQAAAAARGIDVEWGTTVTACRSDGGRPVAVARRQASGFEMHARFLVGADGPASVVRAAAGIPFRGAPYPVDVILADLELAEQRPEVAHAYVSRDGLVLLFPLGEQAPWRLLATVPAEDSGQPFGQVGPPVPPARVRQLLGAPDLGLEVTAVAWSARVRLQHRVAERFRAGPVFLAGDAAHTYSPAGGQGMNAGIQDATNLGWKLAIAAGSHRPAELLLDSYGAERRPVARLTFALTHALFWGEAATEGAASLLRGTAAPLVAPLLPALLRQRRVSAQGVRVLSQLRWHYRRSALSVDRRSSRHASGEAPVRAGERLGDEEAIVDGARVRLHDVTSTSGLQVLLPREAAWSSVGGPLVHVHRVASWRGGDAVVVRPDGYVGYVGPAAGVDQWLARIGVGDRLSSPAATGPDTPPHRRSRSDLPRSSRT